MLRKETFFSRRIKTILRKTRGRSGSLLLLVVIILAVSVILITSALTITVAARNRYYGSALSSQAGLTATSVAKTIAEAAESGDLTTADLDGLVALTTINPVVVTGPKTVAPGLEGIKDATGNTKTSYTDAKFEYSDTYKKNFKITITTYLDAGSKTGQSQKMVTVYLKKNVPAITDGFVSIVAINGSGQLPSITVGNPAGASNFITITGDATSPNNGNGTYNCDIVVTGKIYFGNVTTVTGDFVLLGNKANIYNTGGNRLPKVSGGSFLSLVKNSDTIGSVFTGQTYATGFNGTDLKGAAQIILNNSVMKLTDSTILGTNNYIANNGKIVLQNGTATTKAFTTSTNTIVDKYMNVNGKVQKSLNFTRPATRDAMMTMLGINKAYGTSITGASLISALKTNESAVQITLDANGVTTQTMPLKGSAYIIDTSVSTKIAQAITFDCTDNNVTLYITGNNTLNFSNNDGSIRFIRPTGSGNIGKIVFMENNASFDMGYSDYTLNKFPGITGAGQDPNRYSKTPATITDGSEPYLYIYGYNNNITLNSPKFLEGYIGLYGTGTFIIPGGLTAPPIYARFNAYKLDINGGSAVPIPYCPAPGEGTNSVGSLTPYIISGYITN